MKQHLIIALCAATLPLLALNASAGIVKVPKDSPAITVDIPDSWEPEDTDKGIACESPDKEATVFFEVTSAKKIDALIDENIDWLMKDQKVDIDKSSQKSGEFEANGMKWKTLAWDGKSEDWGPANIMLAFGDAGKGKVVMITYWVTKKGEAKHGKQLTQILDSVKKAGS
jgi:hypothetical protein